MIGGGPITRRGAVFSNDGHSLYIPAQNTVRKHSVNTGELYGSFKLGRHEVTCIIRHPTAPLQVITGSSDGTVSIWIPKEDVLVRSFQLGHHIQHMIVTSEGHLLVSMIYNGTGRIWTYSMDGTYLEHMGQLKIETPGLALASGPSGAVAATFDKHKVMVWRTDVPCTPFLKPLRLHHTKRFTCVAVDSRDDIVAAGDVSGRILIWRNISGLLERVKAGLSWQEPPPTTVHWHAFPVGCLLFSSDSTFLFSGGQEGVLVQWRLDSNTPGFLPRLGGPLTSLTLSSGNLAHVCIGQADNTLRIVDTSNFKVISSIHGIRPRARRRQQPRDRQQKQQQAEDSEQEQQHSAAAAVQPGSGLLVVPASNSSLQFYDTKADRHMTRLQVTMRNPLPPGRGQRPTAEPAVTHTAFSRAGDCLATIDTQAESALLGEEAVALKFWDRSPEGDVAGQAPYVLNTQIDTPHQGPVTSLVFHPTEAMAVTTGGTEFKIWVKAAAALRPGATSTSYWRCRSVGSYREQRLTGCSVSSDGSLLAVASEQCVTLWALPSCTLRAVLRCPKAQAHRIRRLAFVADSPFLVGVAEGLDTLLVVWNLLTASIWWALALPVTQLAADPTSPHFAVALAPQGPHSLEPPRTDQAVQEAQQRHDRQREAGAAAASEASTAEPDLQILMATRTSRVLLFSPESPHPLSSGALLCWQAADLLFTPTAAVGPSCSGGPAPLLMLNEDNQFALLRTPGEPAEEPSVAATSGRLEAVAAAGSSAEDVDTEAGSSAATAADFGHLLKGAAQITPASTVTAGVASASKPLALLEAPSHALPPPSQLCTAFLERMLSL